MISTFFAFCAAALVVPVRGQTSFESCLSAARFSAGAQVVLPSSPAYPNATISTNLLFNYNAAAVVFLGAHSDAAEAIKCALAHDVPVVSRSGRHSYASFGSGGRDGALVLDTTSFKNVEYDPKTGYATVGFGNRLGDLALALDQYGRGTPHGTCAFVGIGGHSTCGGFGMWSRQHGLVVDQVVNYQVATADGHVVTASRTKNADLFWALRGAAPSFGTVLSVTIKTYPQPPVATRFVLDYTPPSDPTEAATFLAKFQDFAATQAPPELGIRVVVIGFSGFIVQFRVHGVYYGTRTAFETAYAPLAAVAPTPLQSSTIAELSYIDVVRSLDGSDQLNSTLVPLSRTNQYTKSLLVPASQPLSLATWNSFTNYSYSVPPLQGMGWFVEIDAFGGSYKGTKTAIPSVSDADAAFNGRDSVLLLQFAGGAYPGPYVPDGVPAWVDGWVGSVTKSVAAENKNVSSYACYVDSLLTADEAHKAYFGPIKTAALKAIKRKWDPKRVFDYPHAF